MPLAGFVAARFLPAPSSRRSPVNDGLPFQDGEQVLLTDQRGKRHLIFLRKSETFHSDRGWVPHDAIIGQPEGSWVRSSMGLRYLALRPDARRVRAGDAARRPGHLSQGSGDDPLLGGHLPRLPRARGRHRVGCPDPGAPARGRPRRARDHLRAARRVRPSRAGEHPHAARRGREPDGPAAAGRGRPRRGGPGRPDASSTCPSPGSSRRCSRGRFARAGSSSATCRPSCSRSRSPRRSSASGTGRSSRRSRRLYRPWNIEGQSVRPFHRMVAHTGFITVARRVVPEESGAPDARLSRHQPDVERALMITVMRRYRKSLQIGLLVVIAAFVASLFVFGATGSPQRRRRAARFGGDGQRRDDPDRAVSAALPVVPRGVRPDLSRPLLDRDGRAHGLCRSRSSAISCRRR